VHGGAHFTYGGGQSNRSHRGYPASVGEPGTYSRREKVLRRDLVEKGLRALETPVDGQVVFEQ